MSAAFAYGRPICIKRLSIQRRSLDDGPHQCRYFTLLKYLFANKSGSKPRLFLLALDFWAAVYFFFGLIAIIHL